MRALIERIVGVRAEENAWNEPAEAAAPREVEIDLELARDLEHASWENTKKLIDAVDRAQENERFPAFDEPVPKETDFVRQMQIPSSQEACTMRNAQDSGQEFSDVYAAYLSSLSSFQTDFLRALLRGADTGELTELAGAEFTLPEAVFEELNDLAQDMIGDIVLDPLTGQIYEEHADALENAIKSME